MDKIEFFQSEPAKRILERASSISGTAISIFDYADDREGASCGGCGTSSEACTYTNKLNWGAQACRKSREQRTLAALKRGKPVPFICHLGFSCVAMPTLADKDSTTAMVLGPFCPSEAPNSLELDALEGLSTLENRKVDELPFTLLDIPVTSARSLPEVAEWLYETLTNSYESKNGSVDSDSEPLPTEIQSKSTGRMPEKQTPFDSGAIVAALVGGDTKQARMLVHGQIIDGASRRRTRTSVQRARCVAVVATILEWAEHADVDTSPCWAKFSSFQESIQSLNDDGELTTAAMKVLSPIHRQKKFPTRANAKQEYDFVPLNNLIRTHFKDGITLGTVAKHLNENPTTITKRLQRTFGLSYSEYVGQMRIEHAKKLLRTTKLTAGEIGKRIGVNDSTNFSKLFRRHAQTTPTNYRAQHRKKQ